MREMVIGILAGVLAFVLILRKPARGMYLASFLLPILITKDLPIVGTKLTIFDPIVFMTGIAWFVRLAVKGDQKLIVIPSILLPLSLFYLACTASLFNTLSIASSVLELASYLYGGALLFLFLQIIQSKGELRKVIYAWLAGSGLVLVSGAIGGMALLLKLDIPFLISDAHKVTATFQYSNQVPPYLMMVFPIYLLFSLDRHKSTVLRTTALVAAFLTVAIVIATGSRSGLMGILIAGGLFFLWQSNKPQTWIALSIVGVVLLGIIGVMGSHIDITGAFRRSTSILAVSDGLPSLKKLSPSRYYQLIGWQEAVDRYPLLGVGVGDFKDRLLQLVPETGKKHEIHNTYLGVWAEVGTIGLVFLVSFLLLLLQYCKRALYNIKDVYWRGIGGAFVIGLAANLFDQLFHFGMRSRHFWLGIAVIVALVLVNDRRAINRDVQNA